MKLKHLPSDNELDAAISEVSKEDFNRIKRDKNFSFDWQFEETNDVYKMQLVSEKTEILGLMSLIDRKDEYRIHINLLETNERQRGKNNGIDNIAACLIAFAAEIAIKRGYYGFVSLTPKTKLIDHYQDKYGFRQYGRYLGIDGVTSQNLVEKHLKDE
ncbi:hypothetical protein G3O08_02160 [Cryomorpha ignava]|uniref:GNAT family N-acetyltransferase n=1 Tax=Cryomorpha ignava TaxID=101383 RepID=A0A7K3WKY7_9FLAO|nr:hypothetical protein [Cryomorpha ignava]NEN22307.1 hypothetical protein [Cryomorpha ignava]